MLTGGYRATIYGVDPDIVRQTIRLVGGNRDTTDPHRDLFLVRTTVIELTKYASEWAIHVNGETSDDVSNGIACLGFDPDVPIQPVVATKGPR